MVTETCNKVWEVGPLFFAGTETATGHGHMEGAVIAAKRVCAEVMEYLAN